MASGASDRRRQAMLKESVGTMREMPLPRHTGGDDVVLDYDVLRKVHSVAFPERRR
ncbi:protein of unknown function [Paraburkholderia kururiensis]